MSINFELYKVFYHVAINLNFSKAAKELYLSQSAVSQNISLLEKELNTKLFNRSTKKVSLTIEGETLFNHIEPAINSIVQGEKDLQDISTLEKGRLHIGASDTICKYYLITYLKSFHELYPNVEILITNRTSIQCVELLRKNQVDLIITNLPNNELNHEFDVVPTIDFNDIIIAPTKYTNLTDVEVSFEQLLDYPVLLLDKQSSTTQYLQKLFNEEGLTLQPAVELGSIDLLVDMATIGLGITFIPDYVHHQHPELMEVKTTTPLNPRRLGIVTRSKHSLSKAANEFIDLIINP